MKTWKLQQVRVYPTETIQQIRCDENVPHQRENVDNVGKAKAFDQIYIWSQVWKENEGCVQDKYQQ